MPRWHRNEADKAAEAANQAAVSDAARLMREQREDVQKQPPQAEEPPETPPRGPRPKPRNDDRQLLLEELERAEMQRKGITAEEKHEDAEAQAKPAAQEEKPKDAAAQQDEKSPEDKAEVKAEETPAADAATPAAPETIKTVRVVVDGEEFDAPLSEVEASGGIKNFQIQKASENRLRKANEALAEARRLQAMMAAMKPQTPAAPSQSDEEFIKSQVDTIRFGTPEESAAALRQVLQRANPRLDPQAIVAQVAMQVQKQNALNNFRTEFPDIVANPMLLKLAAVLEAEQVRAAAAQDPQAVAQLDWPSFYRTIGNQVRAVAGKPHQQAPAGAPAQSGTTSQADKEARKASIVNLPAASGARAKPPEEEKQPTREELLNEMRRARGQI